TPLTAMESPCATSELTRGPRTVIRRDSPVVPAGVRETTSPSSSTIPVNMPLHPFASNGSGKRAWSEELRGRSRPWRHQVARHLARPRALPPIRTLTVGTGFPPVQPADGFGRVADCHRRFGLSPTPEHA